MSHARQFSCQANTIIFPNEIECFCQTGNACPRQGHPTISQRQSSYQIIYYAFAKQRIACLRQRNPFVKQGQPYNHTQESGRATPKGMLITDKETWMPVNEIFVPSRRGYLFRTKEQLLQTKHTGLPLKANPFSIQCGSLVQDKGERL